jgi:hypothetical protein
MSNLSIKEIVKKYLDENGFDGLQYESECGCKKDDLFSCEEPKEDCTAGKITDCKECDNFQNGVKLCDYEYCIGE